MAVVIFVCHFAQTSLDDKALDSCGSLKLVTLDKYLTKSVQLTIHSPVVQNLVM